MASAKILENKKSIVSEIQDKVKNSESVIIFTYQGLTVDKYGRVTAAQNMGYTTNTGTVTKVTAGTGLTGGDITTTGTIYFTHLIIFAIQCINLSENLHSPLPSKFISSLKISSISKHSLAQYVGSS